MKILLKTGSAGNEREIELKDNITLEEVANQCSDLCDDEGDRLFPYRIILARVNGVDRELTEQVLAGGQKSSEVPVIELLDMRTHSANLTYQRTLSMIFLKAVYDLYEARGIKGVQAEIDNSLNKGFFTKLNGKAGKFTEDDVKAIEDRMREIAEADIPIKKEIVTKEEGIRIWNEEGYPEKARLLEEVKDKKYDTAFYCIEEYKNFFFGPMAPSTGYIEYFELRKYKGGMLVRFPYYNKPDEVPPFVDDNRMHEAFRVEHKWLSLLKTEYLADLNDIIAEGKAKDMILLCEALHEKKIAEIADIIKRQNKRIILIAGPSSSGKTTFARRLCVQLRVNGLEPLYLGTDDYFVNREDSPVDEDGNKNYENLDALDIELFNNNMNDLLAGKEVDLPEFDFMEGKKLFGRRITSIKRNQPIVIEGIHGLNDKLTEQIPSGAKYKIYISPLMQLNFDKHNRVPTTDSRMFRRMVRDYKYRGHSAADTISIWPKVRAGEDRNIFPYNSAADVLFNSVLPYEICMLKKSVKPLLEEIRPDQPEYSEAVRLLEFLKFFRTIEEEQYVPNNSILREFLGGSVFVE